jgi:hypothetical protein
VVNGRGEEESTLQGEWVGGSRQRAEAQPAVGMGRQRSFGALRHAHGNEGCGPTWHRLGSRSARVPEPWARGLDPVAVRGAFMPKRPGPARLADSSGGLEAARNSAVGPDVNDPGNEPATPCSTLQPILTTSTPPQ